MDNIHRGSFYPPPLLNLEGLSIYEKSIHAYDAFHQCFIICVLYYPTTIHYPPVWVPREKPMCTALVWNRRGVPANCAPANFSMVPPLLYISQTATSIFSAVGAVSSCFVQMKLYIFLDFSSSEKWPKKWDNYFFSLYYY